MKLLKRLMPKDSFYLILFICISLIGASAVWVSKEKINLAEVPEVEKEKVVDEEIKLDLSEEDVVRKPKEKIEVVPPKEEAKPESEPKPEPKPEPKVEDQPKPEKQEEAKQQEETETVTSESVEVKNTKLKKPVEGKVYKNFSKDKLVYSKTLDEWSTHLGIDIASKEGTNVVSASDGVVTLVKNDDKLGATIVIDHGAGLETIYKNIVGSSVSSGQKVKTGEVIAKVSKGIGYEKLDEAHLHFEVLERGIQVDPNKYF